jgi:DNA polymerase I-like protein with 3'-5' exonuclease and polymerase domains
MLGYSVIFRSEKTGKPSLDKKVVYRLALQHVDNPIIQLVLMYRTVAKEFSTLNFVPWKDDNNKIVNYRTYEQLN